MKKTFPIEVPDRKPARVIDAIKKDVRKYLKRERRKTLPEGEDFWDFDCRVGRESEGAEAVHVAAIIDSIDVAATENWTAIYIEILARPRQRTRKTVDESHDGGAVDSQDSEETSQID